jgi:hypothetical protein
MTSREQQHHDQDREPLHVRILRFCALRRNAACRAFLPVLKSALLRNRGSDTT